jgi:hypothetical protein
LEENPKAVRAIGEYLSNVTLDEQFVDQCTT